MTLQSVINANKAPLPAGPGQAPPAGAATTYDQLHNQAGGSSDNSYVNEDDPDVLVDKGSVTRSYQGSRLSETGTPPQTKKQSQVLSEFYGIKGPELRALQERLFNSGFYGNLKRNQIAWGIQGDDNTLDAYKGAVGRAAGIYTQDKTRDLNGVIDEGAQTQKQDGDGNLFKVSNPEDIQAVIKSSAKQVLGRGVSQDMIDRITSAYQKIEIEHQAQQATAAAGTTDAVVSDAPTPQNFVEDQIRQQNPGEAQAHDFNDAAGAFSQLLTASQNNVVRS